MIRRLFRFRLIAALALLCTQSLYARFDASQFDVVVYGATPSGITAAIAAAREGLHVALVEPGRHIGGMVASGLSHTDRGNVETIGGIPREFFENVGHHYGENVEWSFEPHVASQVFEEMVKQAHVSVFTGARLRRPDGVVKDAGQIRRIAMEDGRTFAAAEFVDATYEGDLMDESGASSTWGRESQAEYGESLAGVLATQRMDLQFRAKVSPYAADGSLLPGISAQPKGALGQADKKIPSYNFRLCVTTDKANQIPFPRPDGYDPRQYELLARYLPILEKTLGRPLEMKDVFLMESLKGNKWDLNNMGAFSTDYTGTNWKFPTASYEERAAMFKQHTIYEAGLLYFLAHDPRIPPELQALVNSYGLAKDEFTDTDHWPWQLYIRESRRMIGQYVFTQHDALENITKPDSVGMGSYQLDSHNVQRVVTADGFVENEGDYYVETKPYEVPFRSIVPRSSEVANLVVPVCMSATHAAYGTIRQEPVYMILGQAAGTAAAIAFHEHRKVQDVPVPELQSKLQKAHAVLHWSAEGAAGSGTQNEQYDVIVAGAGTGGSAAAIQAARMGARVALLEESDWIGGQMTAAGVGTMDEGNGPESTPPSGFYAEFLERVRNYYRPLGKSINTCYWNTKSHCFDPQVARKVLHQMIDDVNAGQKGHIDLFLEDRVVKVLSEGNTVTGVVTSKGQTWHSKILIDATEYGDVLPLTPARYRSGNTIGPDLHNSCTQAVTWTATIRKYSDGVPPELQMHNPPPGYEQWVDKFRHSMRADGNPVNRNLPVGFPMYAAYRAVPDLANPKDYTAAEPREITRTSMNWFDDFDVTTAVLDRATRKDIICEAKLKTLSELYYLQHEGGEPLWSVANDEGYDTAYSRANACPQIPAEYKAIEYDLPQIPYVRESNRLVGEITFTGGDIRREHNWAPSVIGYTDGIAVGDYADDLHGCNRDPGFFEQDLEHITDLPPGFRFGPFQVPLRTLIPEKVDGLLAAEKNISQSRLANGATRLQPITMLTGQAAGTLAALAVSTHRQPRDVPADSVQLALLRSGDILAREHMTDLTIGSEEWQAAQFAVVHQWISVDADSGFQPDKPLTRGEAARILVSALLGDGAARPVVSNTGGFDPPPQILERSYDDVPLYDPLFNTVAALHAAGAAPVCSQSPGRFCPSDPMTMKDFAQSVRVLLSLRKHAAVPTSDTLLAGIKGDENDPVTRGKAALILFHAVGGAGSEQAY